MLKRLWIVLCIPWSALLVFEAIRTALNPNPIGLFPPWFDLLLAALPWVLGWLLLVAIRFVLNLSE